MIDNSLTAKVILTSDDFGLSQVYNEKIIEMLRLNYLTSVSVMVKRISKEQKLQIQALRDINKTGKVSTGLHLELSKIDYLNDVKQQWSLFEAIFGFCPNYLDLHKKKLFKGNYDQIASFCNSNNIPFRKYSSTSMSVKGPTLSITATYISIEKIKEIIDHFAVNEICEFIFHIGTSDPNSGSKLNIERERDSEKLIEINQFIRGKKITLINYNEFKNK